VLVHLILFTPRGDLSAAERDGLIASVERASRDIPSVRRVAVGRRITVGRPYEQLTTEHYDYVATLEFDDREGLQCYLDHPAHTELATRFFAALAKAQIYDFELSDTLRELVPPA
jgi:hypothetical protein